MFLSQQVKQNVIITNKNVKCQLTDKLQNDIRLRKSQNSIKLLSIVQSSSQNENIVNTGYFPVEQHFT